ncbi:hypothetical protein RRG08_011844 [Elysia crispata]|uniref:G-protein coupled receptors family 1 profile domain-containing protein n=1 Tax=Elysia crispata TaxID=231223 RepID=A0AAE0ZCM6_9GAST|nr:hypothetical protein RRG08_011844 [Elysia crispata]
MASSGFNNTTNTEFDHPKFHTTPPVDNRDLYELIEAFLGIFIVMCALVLNSLILAAFIRDVRLQVVFNYYMFHLAMADILYCFVVNLKFWLRWFDFLPLSASYMCLLATFISMTVTLQQLFLLHLMTSDRYSAVKRGLTYKRKTTMTSQPSPELERVTRHSRNTETTVKSAPTVSLTSFGQAPTLTLSTVSGGATTRSSFQRCAGTNLARQRIKVMLTWLFSSMLGFILADVGATLYQNAFDKCLFPTRFLYIHYSSLMHAALLATLLLHFLAILREYWRQKQRGPRCCPCLGRARPQVKTMTFCEPPKLMVTSSCQLKPRSPNISTTSLDTVPEFWLSSKEENPQRNQGLTTETSIDNNQTFSYIADGKSFSNKQHNHNVSGQRSALAAPGGRHTASNRPVLTLKPRMGPDKEALLPREEAHQPDVKTSPSRSSISGRITLNFERRFRANLGHVLLKEEGEEVTFASFAENRDMDLGGGVRAKKYCGWITGKNVGLEFTENGLETYFIDTRSTAKKLEARFIDIFSSINDQEPRVIDTYSSINEQEHRVIDTYSSINEYKPHVIDTFRSINEQEPRVIDTFSSINEQEHHVIDTYSSINEQKPDAIDTFSSINQQGPRVIDTCSPSSEQKAPVIGKWSSGHESEVLASDGFSSIDQCVAYTPQAAFYSPPKATVTRRLSEQWTSGRHVLCDLSEKSELHKSARIFNSIDKYWHEPTNIQEKRSETCAPIQQDIDPMQASKAEENTEPVVDISDSTAPILPALSFSDDELTEIPGGQFNKVRTDSLYTLRSCLSIQEDNQSSASLDQCGREISSSSITRNESETTLTRKAHSGSLSWVKNNVAGSGGALGVSPRRRGAAGTKSALFTIGDGNEDTEDDDLEREWKGWDNLFGCHLRRDGQKDRPCSQASTKDTGKFDPFFIFPTVEAHPLVEQTSASDASARAVIRSHQLASDNSVGQLKESTTYSMGTARGQPCPVDNNVNQNDTPEQRSSDPCQRSQGQKETFEEKDKDVSLFPVLGAKRTFGHLKTSNGGEKFYHLGKKKTARYRLMLKDWTCQSLDKERNSSLSSSSSAHNKSAVDTWLQFYQVHCSPDPDGQTYGLSGSTVASNTTAATRGESIRRQHLTHVNTEGRLAGHVGWRDKLSTQSRVEVEEDADTEDGLLTSQQMSEVDEAVGQWLAFYGVTEPAANNTSEGQTSLDDDEDVPERANKEWPVPELRAVGCVTYGDLLKARQIWFQFYDVKTRLQTHSATWEKTPNRVEDTVCVTQRPYRLPMADKTQKYRTDSESSGNTRSAYSTEAVNGILAEHAASSAVDPGISGVLGKAVRKINLEKGRKSKAPACSVHHHATENFSSELYEKLKALSSQSPRHFCGCEREVCEFNQEEILENKSDSKLGTRSTHDLIGEQKSKRCVRSPSLDELSVSHSSRPSEAMSDTYPSLPSSDTALSVSSSAVDPFHLVKQKKPGVTIRIPSGQLSRKIDRHYIAEDLKCNVAQTNRSLACREPKVDVTTPPHESPTALSTSTASPILDQHDIQVCPPCSPASEAMTPGGKSALSNSTQTDYTTRHSPATLDGVTWEPSATDLASRLLESVSLKRRALLAELGLYQDLLSGLIPLEWSLPRAASDAARDVERGEGHTQVPGQSRAEADLELGLECPHCLRRTRDQHAQQGRCVEATFRRLFGMQAPAFEDHTGTEPDSDPGDIHSSKGLRLTGNGIERVQSAKGRDEMDELYPHHVEFLTPAGHDGVNDGAECASQSSRDLPSGAWGAHPFVSSSNSAEPSNKNNSNNGGKIYLGLLNTGTCPGSDRASSAATGTSTRSSVMPKQRLHQISSLDTHGYFDTLILTDPLLALVLTHGLILLAQFLTWSPRTFLFIYYDLFGFPTDQTRLELMVVLIWYTRLIFTPCVCLLYSRGFRENLEQIISNGLLIFSFGRSPAETDQI